MDQCKIKYFRQQNLGMVWKLKFSKKCYLYFCKNLGYWGVFWNGEVFIDGVR